jgi:hypothetical protein
MLCHLREMIPACNYQAVRATTSTSASTQRCQFCCLMVRLLKLKCAQLACSQYQTRARWNSHSPNPLSLFLSPNTTSSSKQASFKHN